MVNLLHCGCKWSGVETHYCANRPESYTMPRVEKWYRQERPNPEPWKRMTDADCFEFLAAHPEGNAFSPRVRLWSWLEHEFGTLDPH